MEDHNRRYGVLASLPGYTVEHPSCCKAQAQSDIPCQTSDLSKDTLIPQGFSWFLTLLQMTMLDMMGWLFYHDLVTTADRDRAFAFAVQPMLSLWGWVYRERRSRCWSPDYPLFILSFDSLHIERPQHLKATVWVHFPRLICTTEWLQLTQRTNPGRSRDWPKGTESFGFVSQWDWTFIKYIELVLAQLNFYMKQHSTRYGYIQTDTCPIRDCLKVASTIGVRCTMASDRECPKCLVGISLFSIAITPFWEFCAETRYVGA